MTNMVARPDPGGSRPFVGRGRELAVATTLLEETDRAGVALIGGESGLGKTRLVTEIIAAAPDGTHVVRGGAVPRQTPIPFELIHSAMGRVADSDEDHPPATQVLAAAEALRALHNESTIYVFEDVHWADAESLEVIDRLMAAGPLGASVLVTYRPNALRPGHPGSTFLQRAERRSHVAQLRLEPLRRDEVADYLAAVGRAADAKTVEHVHSRTGGNPLLLSELVAATDDEADLTGGLPWTLAEMLRPEIERLPGNERVVAEAVAVLGIDVGFEVVAAAVQASEDQLLESLRSLVILGILVESGPDRFSFRHDLVREAVADSLFTRERRRIHAAVHDALLASGSDDVVALITHATGAGRTKQAADVAREAAFAALEGGSSHQALAFAEEAMLVHTDDIGLLRVAVVAGWMIGQERAAFDHLDRWEELVGPGLAERAEILHHRVRLLWEQSDTERAERVAEELAAVVEAMDPSVSKAQALADLAQHHMLNGRAGPAMATADLAIAMAEKVGPGAADAALQARAERASASLWGGVDLEETVSELLAVVTDAEAASNHVVASRALNNVPIEGVKLDARTHLERMRRASQRAGLTCIATGTYRTSLLFVAEIEGDRDAYEPLLNAALEDLPDNAEVVIRAMSLALDDGRVEDARRLAKSISNLPRASHHADTRSDGVVAFAELVLGDSGPARSWFEEAETEGHTGAMETILRFLSSIVAAGLIPDLRGYLRRRSDAQSSGEACFFIDPAIRGIEAEFLGDDPAKADDLYDASLGSGFRRSVFDEVEVHLARARLATILHRDERPHLEAAGQILVRWPGRRQDLVASLLGESCCDDAPTLLTPREREVATLVTRGLTNGGIADELFISTKTASVHVSNILAKLGMSSRTEIAAWVAGGALT